MFISLGFFFRMLNFFVVISLCVYLFKKHVLSALLEQKKLQEQEVDMLHKERKLCKVRQAELQQQMHDQELECQRLMMLVDQWSSAEKKEQEHIERAYAAMSEVKQLRMQQQQQMREQRFVRQQVAPRVLQQSQQELKNYFADMHIVEKFTADVIERVRGGSSS